MYKKNSFTMLKASLGGILAANNNAADGICALSQCDKYFLPLS